jgi:5-methyltetrahydrofolate--homocysteine methyltransferase
MHDLIKRMMSSAPVICDGGWGTELQAVGLAPGEIPDGWNLRFPERVKRVASRYVDAGSRVILTNTFQANRVALERAGLGDSLAIINRAGVILSRAAARDEAHVFASVGPTGKLLADGSISETEVHAAFKEQTSILAEAGAEAIVLETFSDLGEITIAVAAAREAGLPVIGSMVYDSGKQHDRTMMGTTPEDAAHALEQAGVTVIGANCGTGIEDVIPVCERLRAATSLPIWIKPNAGLPEMADGHVVYRQSAEDFALHARALRKAGASFIGGCCGTTPQFIRALSDVFIDG